MLLALSGKSSVDLAEDEFSDLVQPRPYGICSSNTEVYSVIYDSDNHLVSPQPCDASTTLSGQR